MWKALPFHDVIMGLELVISNPDIETKNVDLGRHGVVSRCWYGFRKQGELTSVRARLWLLKLHWILTLPYIFLCFILMMKSHGASFRVTGPLRGGATHLKSPLHDDVMTWNHSYALFVRGIHRCLMDSPLKRTFNAELCCFPCRWSPEQAIEQIFVDLRRQDAYVTSL